VGSAGRGLRPAKRRAESWRPGSAASWLVFSVVRRTAVRILSHSPLRPLSEKLYRETLPRQVVHDLLRGEHCLAGQAMPLEETRFQQQRRQAVLCSCFYAL